MGHFLKYFFSTENHSVGFKKFWWFVMKMGTLLIKSSKIRFELTCRALALEGILECNICVGLLIFAPILPRRKLRPWVMRRLSPFTVQRDRPLSDAVAF